ncbi:MAG: hypothetical protein P8Q94_00630 [Candidatus Poseidoniaceae archaeon]|nr:hypothetical protein [Candidatus Poseidoniaceae archaeon]
MSTVAKSRKLAHRLILDEPIMQWFERNPWSQSDSARVSSFMNTSDEKHVPDRFTDNCCRLIE